MPQLRYEKNLRRAVEGMPHSSHTSADVITALNDDPRAQQVVEFTYSGDGDDDDTAVEINGVRLEPDGDQATGDQADELELLVNEEPLLSGSVEAESDGTDTVTVTAKIGGIGFTFDAAGADVAASETQANAQADPIPFGRAVLADGQSEDGSELLCKRLDADEAPLGIALYTGTFEQERDTDLGSNFERQTSEYPPLSAVNVFREGRIYVPVEEDIDVGDPVYVRHTADGDLDDLGAFAGSAGTGLREVTDARWVRGSDDRDDLAVLQVDFV